MVIVLPLAAPFMVSPDGRLTAAFALTPSDRKALPCRLQIVVDVAVGARVSRFVPLGTIVCAKAPEDAKLTQVSTVEQSKAPFRERL